MSIKMEFAIFSDCRELIKKFAQNGSSQFNNFSKLWKDEHFHNIYLAQTNNIELIMTTTAAMHIGKRIVCGKDLLTEEELPRENIDENASMDEDKRDKEFRMLCRIGGMFLLYALYFRQPTTNYVKIEVSMETWCIIKAFIDEELPNSPETDDVRYTFWKLVKSHAFRFTALDFYVGLDQLVNYDVVESEQELKHPEITGTKNFKEIRGLEEVIRKLPPLVLLEEGYNEMKEKLAMDGNEIFVNSKPTDLFNDLFKSFKTIRDTLKSSSPLKTGTITNSAPTDEKTDSGAKRRLLKQKGHEIDNTQMKKTTEKESQSIPIMQNLRRMSARTVFADKLPSELLMDLEYETDMQDYEEDEEDDELSERALEECIEEVLDIS